MSYIFDKSIGFGKLFIFLCFLMACKNNNGPVVNSGDSGKIFHLVFFDLKDDISNLEMDSLISRLEELSKIESVGTLSFGPYADMNDERALKEFDVCLQMTFESKEAYQHYQNHPLHLELKSSLKPLLKSVPRSYDFENKS